MQTTLDSADGVPVCPVCRSRQSYYVATVRANRCKRCGCTYFADGSYITAAGEHVASREADRSGDLASGPGPKPE